MNTVEIGQDVKPKLVDFEDMKEGQIGVIREAPSAVYNDLIVIRGYAVVVGLREGETWDSNVDMRVELLNPGTILTITLKESL